MIKKLRNFILLNLIFCVFSGTSFAKTAREIMEMVDANSRERNESVFSLLKISTCKYGIKDQKVKCSQAPTIKTIESVAINTGPSGKDNQSIAFILEPPAERGVGMLVYTYDEIGKDNETWLYLSALGKVKRIVSSNSDADAEPVAIFGSEFTNEDQETGKLNDYNFKLLKETNYKSSRVAIIEQTPKPNIAIKSRYSKSLLWVDLAKEIVVKAKMYDKRGAEIRRLLVGKIEKLNDVWLARSTTILNLNAKRLSNMMLVSINFGMEINSDLLSKRSLTDKAFRKKHLDDIRAQTE